MLNKMNTPFISSFVFASNIYHLSYKHNTLYKNSFTYLLASSLLYHSARHKKLYYYIDQIGVYNIYFKADMYFISIYVEIIKIYTHHRL